jgi:protein-disulfide isomerase
MTENAPAPAPTVAPPAGGDDFIHLRRSHLVLALIPLSCAAGLALGYLFWGRPNAAPETLAAADAAQPGGVPQRFDVSVDDDPSTGPEDAPITIVEFSDFNCPYCRKFQGETFPALMATYPNQIRFVYRDFPITSAESFVAAQAANCAGRQGAYWDFHDALFSGQAPLGRETYDTYAAQLGLDVEALNTCIDEGGEAAEVEADARAAAALGVNGTPTFFINGIPLVGAQPLVNFRSVIDGELNP